ncbi:uncharacterized protein EDB91DRAFT_1035604, partial [Suillus paluster]|uniref:uncharacterized protein n=1 Tax=Suillus paluster TaxID=48578 RepID=UPI001B86EF0F
NAHGVKGNIGDKHYKCYHGQCKILTITKAMRSSLNAGLIGHIKMHFLAMYQLYLYLKNHDEPPTEDEVAIASGQKILDSTLAVEYLLKLRKALSSIEAEWDQDTFERLLAEWMVTCNQPFEEVDRL